MFETARPTTHFEGPDEVDRPVEQPGQEADPEPPNQEADLPVPGADAHKQISKGEPLRTLPEREAGGLDRQAV